MDESHALWTEKYRPKKFEEVKGQEEIVSKVKAFVEHKNMPHLLFAGPAGVGKSSLSLVIARQLFGENWRDNFLELNASDERGIDTVRIKVKDFARTKALGNVPFKIIFLDECDALTKEAQQALRRTMEMNANTCRFVLAANYSSKIIEPIQSRCVVFRFKPLSKDHLRGIIQQISQQEHINLTPETEQALIDTSEGDCRKLENTLQSCTATTNIILPQMIYSLAALAQPTEIKTIIQQALNGKFIEAKNTLFDTMTKYGLSGTDIIKQIQKEIWNLEIQPTKKILLIDKCGEIEFRMVEGSDQFIQLESLLANLARESINN